jgi:acyl carrier protein
MEKFIESFAEILELDESEITSDFNFQNTANWDSLAQLSLIALADDDYGVILTSDELKSIKTVEELFKTLQP